MSNETTDYTQSDLERLACKTVENDYVRNRDYWKPDHDRQHRLFDLVMGAPNEDKPDVEGRSNVKTGVAFMILLIIVAVLKSAYFVSAGKNIKLIPSKLRKIIFGKEEMEECLDQLLNDEQKPTNKAVKAGLFDLVSHGTGVLRPFWFDDKRIVFDEMGGKEYIYQGYQGPSFVEVASWDTFPTAGVKSVEQLHEVIFREWVYPHELRQWQKNGWVDNVDELLKDIGSDGSIDHGVPDVREPRETDPDKIAQDNSGRICILTRVGYFPLYKYNEYLDDSGKDRSKDEVPTLIIKAHDKNICLHISRVRNFGQTIEAIFGKYFDIAGLFWGESYFGMYERLLLHQEDWFNLMQDEANFNVGQDRVMPESVPQEQREQKGYGREYVITDDNFDKRRWPTNIERNNSALGELANQRDVIERMVTQTSGIMEFMKSLSSQAPVTATEIERLAQSVNVRFEGQAEDVRSSYIQPVVNWMMSMMTQFSDDAAMEEQLELPFNPFKQFDAMMPNKAYRIELEGSNRAIRSAALQRELQSIIEQAKTIPPGDDGSGQLKQTNPMAMFIELLKSSALKSTDKFVTDFVPLPIAAPGEGGAQSQGPGGQGAGVVAGK